MHATNQHATWCYAGKTRMHNKEDALHEPDTTEIPQPDQIQAAAARCF